MQKLLDRKRYVKGKCKGCKWLELCGGGLRSRAFANTGDPWAEDPGCYLSDDEIGLTTSGRPKIPVIPVKTGIQST